MILKYELVKKILNDTIFSGSKVDLLIKIAKYPERYIGIFRPTKPKAKILQNLLQSHEIRFGDALENIIEEYFNNRGYKTLNKKIITSDGDELNIDQIFTNNQTIYFIEQKVRDDHDSTKKRGQIQNFEKKISELLKKYNEKKMECYFYFIDYTLQKNKNYYADEIKRIKNAYGVNAYLSYGKELFEKILGLETGNQIWEEILLYLNKWKKEIPDLPETNFDLKYLRSYEEIKDINPTYFLALFSDETIFNEMVLTIFPEKKVLKLLQEYFEIKGKDKKIYNTLSEILKSKV